MGLVMNLIFILFISLLISFTAVAKGTDGVLIHPLKPGQTSSFYVVSKNYEDVRGFDKKTKRLKYWMIKAQNLRIEKFYNAEGLSSYRASEISKDSVKEVVYKRKNGTLKLVSALKRPSRLMAGQISKDAGDNICKVREDLISSLSSLSKDLSTDVCIDNLESKIIDPKCKQVYGNAGYEKLIDSYANNLALTDDSNKVLSCLNNPETAKNLSQACSIKLDDTQTQLEVIALRYKLNASKFYAGPPLIDRKIQCDQSKPGPSAQTDEQGNTTYFLNSPIQTNITSKDMDKLVIEELLHGAGVSGEVAVKNLVNLCVEKTKVEGCDRVSEVKAAKAVSSENSGSRGIIRDPDRAAEIVQALGQDVSVKIGAQELSGAPQTLPDSGPSPEALTQSTIASSSNVSADSFGVDTSPNGQGARAMFQNSLSMTGGPIGTAKRLMNMASASLPNALASGGSSKSTRSPASAEEGTSRKSTLPKVRDYSAKSKFNEVAYEPDELDTNVAKNNVAKSSNDANPSNEELAGNASGRRSNSAEENSQTIAAPSRSSKSSGGGGSSGSTSSALRNRQVASVGNNNREQLKIAQLIEEASYNTIKNELANKDFLKKLEVNNISIVRKVNRGTRVVVQTYGAKNGDIVYTDKVTEAKFVREK